MVKAIQYDGPPGRRKAIELARFLGMAINETEDDYEYAWDGKQLFVRRMEDVDIFHDIAHWQLAPPSRRKKPDFGLGAGPDSFGSMKSSVSQHYGYFEERLASVLGIAYMAAFNLDYVDNLIDHGWFEDGTAHDQPHHNFWEAVVTLNQRGLLQNHVPTVLIENKRLFAA